MKRCRITVEYDGSRYCGWQVQKNGPSVQEALEKAASHLTGESERVKGAGRTDAGVHARGQTAVLSIPDGLPVEKAAEALNSRLPDDIAVVAAREAPDGFDPRHDCILKQYSYALTTGSIRPGLENRRSWHVKWTLDVSAMERAAGFFLGTHDFTSFCNRELAGGNNVRTIERSELLVLPPDPAGRGRLVYLVEGRSFLYNMVRALAGTLVQVGAGRFAPGDIPGILGEKDRAKAGMSAPPWGLCLEWTLYPGDIRPLDRAR
jgi:pseudouridylate synthase I